MSAAWPGRCRRRAIRLHRAWTPCITGDVPIGAGSQLLGGHRGGHGLCLPGCSAACTLDGVQARAALPEGGERVRGHALRHHGPVHHLAGQARPCPAHRLPQPGVPLVPIPAGCSLIVCDTKKRRGLVDSEYNTRARRSARPGARALRRARPARRHPGASSQARQGELAEVTRKRCRHVVTRGPARAGRGAGAGGGRPGAFRRS